MHPLSFSARRAVATLVAVPALLLGACTSTDGASSDPPAESASTDTAEVKDRRLRLDHRVTRVAGDLSPEQRARLERRLGPVVRSYLEPAFLRSYPMAGPGRSFAGFTPGARRLARKDERLLTGVGLDKAEDVRVRRASAYYSVVAPSSRAVGVTARLVVDVRATRGERTRSVRLRGRLLLTPTRAGWRIFGYDVSRAGADALESRNRKPTGRNDNKNDKGRGGDSGRSGTGKGNR